MLVRLGTEHGLTHKLLKQDVGWYDTNKSEELSSRVAESAQAIEEGISSKLSLGCRYFFQGTVGLTLSFYYKWDVALVLVHPPPPCPNLPKPSTNPSPPLGALQQLR
jgi:hypothetical protein